MNIQIDNYYISVSKYGHMSIMSICVDGQMIIHDQVHSTSRSDVISYAIKAIDKYNKRHNVEWGRASLD